MAEAMASVDAESRRRFREALVPARNQGAAVLLAPHELGAVAGDPDGVPILSSGKIVFDGPPGDLTATGVNFGVHEHDLPLWLEWRA